MNTLDIQQLSKTYPNGVQALDQVSLTIQNGMYGLLGANGAGKSTLMRTIATLQSPSSGRILFNGEDIQTKPNVVRNGLGYLPQEFGVYPKTSAIELLHHIAVLKGLLDKKERERQIENLLHQTNLWEHRKKHVQTYSGGMRRRFGIAQALLGNPRIIIVDEPTAGLDPEERHRFLNLLSKIGEDIIVILSTHIVADVYNLCSNMAILDRGRILVHGNPSDLVKTLDGKVWKKTISTDELNHYRENHQVISTRLAAGNTQIHIKADHAPGNDFEAVTPNLEDFYFSMVSTSEPQTMGVS
ncbi:ABC transporter ATP-binding protein [Gracilimonas mengyeensis]|uniref:ABC-type multidrug transport system, ATPase component n=1 Tax=Gracilimonas mengyeensis TaxID=1302730 RepID=A0A521ESP9_9BACT|nr:ABC transporter ATP-binding protein [Gracilimonas mengyeensis]SMO86937.1 ABC-type multidrug transport system, ATPase component [Gracilimonas mengyeensis]